MNTPDIAALANNIKAAIAELADGRKFPDLNAAVDTMAAEVDRLRAQVSALSREAWTWSKALETQLGAQVAPAGYVLVPGEPTPEMLEAGRWSEYGEETSRLHAVDDEDVRAVWSRMLAAAKGSR